MSGRKKRVDKARQYTNPNSTFAHLNRDEDDVDDGAGEVLTQAKINKEFSDSQFVRASLFEDTDRKAKEVDSYMAELEQPGFDGAALIGLSTTIRPELIAHLKVRESLVPEVVRHPAEYYIKSLLAQIVDPEDPLSRMDDDAVFRFCRHYNIPVMPSPEVLEVFRQDLRGRPALYSPGDRANKETQRYLKKNRISFMPFLGQEGTPVHAALQIARFPAVRDVLETVLMCPDLDLDEAIPAILEKFHKNPLCPPLTKASVLLYRHMFWNVGEMPDAVVDYWSTEYRNEDSNFRLLRIQGAAKRSYVAARMLLNLPAKKRTTPTDQDIFADMKEMILDSAKECMNRPVEVRIPMLNMSLGALIRAKKQLDGLGATRSNIASEMIQTIDERSSVDHQTIEEILETERAAGQLEDSDGDPTIIE